MHYFWFSVFLKIDLLFSNQTRQFPRWLISVTQNTILNSISNKSCPPYRPFRYWISRDFDHFFWLNVLQKRIEKCDLTRSKRRACLILSKSNVFFSHIKVKTPIMMLIPYQPSEKIGLSKIKNRLYYHFPIIFLSQNEINLSNNCSAMSFFSGNLLERTPSWHFPFTRLQRQFNFLFFWRLKIKTVTKMTQNTVNQPPGVLIHPTISFKVPK